MATGPLRHACSLTPSCTPTPGMDAGGIENIRWVRVRAVDLPVLTIDLVPKPLWGKSLANLLPKDRWDKVHVEVRQRSEAMCEICGESRQHLDCDEVWAYDNDARVAHLARLRMICPRCHQAKHFGRTTATSDQVAIEVVIAHFCQVNCRDRSTFEAHRKAAGDVWLERSRAGEWTVDFGVYAKEFKDR